MTKHRVGERVGAIIAATSDKIIHFAGYGTYAGDVVPPPGVQFFGANLSDHGVSNPRIDLDSGRTIWGCQCWWGPEEEIARRLKLYESQGYKIVLKEKYQ